MPESVLVALILSVAVYGGIVGIAALRALRQRQPEVQGESAPTSISLILPPDAASTVPADEPDGDERNRTLNVDIVRADSSAIRSGLDGATGEVVLIPGTEPANGADWTDAMSRHCVPETPVVAGPTVVEHHDHFLSRLEALQHIGYTALFAGLNAGPPPRTRGCPNLAVRAEAWHRNRSSDGPDLSAKNAAASFVDDPDATLRCPPADSFGVYFSRLVELVQKTWQSVPASEKCIGLTLLIAHSVLLVCCAVAVARPAWRQPTLLALLGKMAADAVLVTPTARQYGERGLLRSFVPSELLLVLVVPFAGLFALPGLQDLVKGEGRSP